jgi:hypothetical protein
MSLSTLLSPSWKSETLAQAIVEPGTSLSGDTLAWCPDTFFTDFFAVGCYSHQDGIRYGSILLYKFLEPATLHLIQRVPTKAVLDLKWYFLLDFHFF